MKNNQNILLVKETRAGEKRVSLTPSDVRKLILASYKVCVETGAGEGAKFSDQDYKNWGATIRIYDNDLFNDIDLIVRVKRPDHKREIWENKLIKPNTIMIGALDPLEKNSNHIDQYNVAGIDYRSIDQLSLSADDPMNILSSMSKLAGSLALKDAINKCEIPINKVVVIGYGTAGVAIVEEAIKQNLNVEVVLTNPKKAVELNNNGVCTTLLQRNDNIENQQKTILGVVKEADIVLTTARKPNEKAPLLIPLVTLNKMKKSSVVVDLALSEGGNVEGSEHDKTLLLGNNVLVTNVSGYPKVMPQEASVLWSQVSFLCVKSILV